MAAARNRCGETVANQADNIANPTELSAMREVHRVYLERPGDRKYWRYVFVDSFNKKIGREGTKIELSQPISDRVKLRMCCDKLAELRLGNGSVSANPPGSPIPEPQAAGLSLGEALAEHIRLNPERRASTLADDKRAMAALAETVGGDGVKLAEIGPEQVAQLSARMMRPRSDENGCGFSRTTRDLYIRRLCCLWHLFISRKRVETNPFSRTHNRDLPKPKKIETSGRFFTREEIAAMIQSAPTIWWKALLSVYGDSGLRRGEALYLRHGAITHSGGHYKLKLSAQRAETWTDPKTGVEYHLPAWTCKTDGDRSYRSLPIPASTAKALAAVPRESPYIFIGLKRLRVISRKEAAGVWAPNSNPIPSNRLYPQFEKIQIAAAKLMGSRDWEIGSLHDLRKSYLSAMSDVVSPDVLQSIGGHHKIETTMKFYTDPKKDASAKILKALEPSNQRRL